MKTTLPLIVSLLITGLAQNSSHAGEPNCDDATQALEFLMNEKPDLVRDVPGFGGLALCSGAEVTDEALAETASDAEIADQTAVCGVFAHFPDYDELGKFARAVSAEFGAGSFVEFPSGQNLKRVRICGEVHGVIKPYPSAGARNN